MRRKTVAGRMKGSDCLWYRGAGLFLGRLQGSEYQERVEHVRKHLLNIEKILEKNYHSIGNMMDHDYG